MSTMNISLPETLKSFVDNRVAEGHYGTSSEYVRELIRKDQGREQLRKLILDGLDSPPSNTWDVLKTELQTQLQTDSSEQNKPA